MTKAVDDLKTMEENLEKLSMEMFQISEAQGDVQVFIKFKRDAELLIEKLPKDRKAHWTTRLKKIKKPRKTMSSAEKQKLRMSQVVSSVKSPTHALAVGVGEPMVDESAKQELNDETPIDLPSNSTSTEEHEVEKLAQDIQTEPESKETIQETPIVPVTPPMNPGDLPDSTLPSINNNADNISTADIEGSKKKRLAKLRAKTKKVKVEDTHTRKTYLVRNDLLERIEQVSNGTHGFKIEFINFAIELALAEYEQEEETDNE